MSTSYRATMSGRSSLESRAGNGDASGRSIGQDSSASVTRTRPPHSRCDSVTARRVIVAAREPRRQKVWMNLARGLDRLRSCSLQRRTDASPHSRRPVPALSHPPATSMRGARSGRCDGPQYANANRAQGDTADG